MMRLFVLFACLLITASSWAAIYYVSDGTHGETSASDANSCTQAQNISTPKRSIDGAAEDGNGGAIKCMVTPGDTILVRGGTYQDRIHYAHFPLASGTAGNPLTFKAYPGETVLFQNNNCRALFLGNNNYITVDGINMDGLLIFDPNTGTNNCFAFTANLNNVAYHTGGPLIQFDYPSNGSNVIIRNLTVSNSPGANIFRGTNMLVENVTVYNTGWGAEYVGYLGANGIYAEFVQNSTFRYVTSYGNSCDGIRIHDSHAGSGGANGNVIEYSIAYSNGPGKGLNGTAHQCVPANGTSQGGFDIADHNNTLRNSIAFDNATRGIWQYGGAPNGNDGNKFYNNTLYKNGTSGGIIVESGVTNATYINNISVESPSGSNFINAGSGTVTTTNKFSGLITDCTVSTSNFHLKTGTNPCVDTGTTIGSVLNDFDSITRPQGVAYDLGAYERPIGGGDVTPPGVPTGLAVQ